MKRTVFTILCLSGIAAMAAGQLPAVSQPRQIVLTPRERVVYDIAKIDMQIEALQIQKQRLVEILAVDDPATTSTLEGAT